MDDFAQTREADVLFESEVSAPGTPPPSAPTEPRAFATRGRSGGGGGNGGAGAGGGGGGGGGGSSGGGGGHGRGGSGRGGLQPRKDGNTPKDTPPVVEGAPEGPAAEMTAKADRTLSGGLKKPKLTEEELTARLEFMKLNNERLLDRRRKADEDESSFQAQEEARKQADANNREARRQADANKRFVERKKKVEQDRNRKELDDEREKNRQRKLSAVQSREWDSTKTEEDYNPRKQSSRPRRGAYGSVVGPPALQNGPPTSPRGAPSPQRGASMPPRGAPTGPRRDSTALGRSPSKNPATTQEWPSLPVANVKPPAEDGPPTKDELSANDEPISKDTLPTNDQPAAINEPAKQDQPQVEDKTPEEAPGEQEQDTGGHVNSTISPLSPAVGGSSWAEQVEANT